MDLKAKLKGSQEQYQALEEAIRTPQFVRTKCLQYWMDNKGVGRNDLHAH